MRSFVNAVAVFTLLLGVTLGVTPDAANAAAPDTGGRGPSMGGRSAATPSVRNMRLMRNAFGGAIAVGDGEVFVGEPQNSFRAGTVYIYRKAGAVWKQAAVLNAPQSAVADPFGSSLTVEGSSLFVGAGPATVYEFRKSGSTWKYAATINASQAGADEKFGNAMSASGAWLLVGRQAAGRAGFPAGGQAAGATPPRVPGGAVYAFRRGADGQYSFHSKIARPDSVNAGDGFGSAVKVSGNVALIGASGQMTNQGIVHEYNLDASGVWQPKRTFTPAGVSTNDRFGSDIAIHGQYAVISALGDGGGYGASYLFQKIPTTIRQADGTTVVNRGIRGPQMRDDSAWVEVARLVSPAGSRSDRFAQAIAITDREVFAATAASDFNGAVVVFRRDTLGVTPTPAYIATGLTNSAGSVMTLAARNNVLAVGTPNAERGRGSVLIYERNAAGAWMKQTVLKPAMDELTAMTGKEAECKDGQVGPFECGNSSLVSFLPPSRLTADGHYVEMNDVWGWTDPVTKKEWAIMGRQDGTTFVDVTNPLNPIPVADLPLTAGARPAAWRDMKVYKDHAFIVADGSGPHGMQVFDLKRLRTIKPVGARPALVKSDTVYKMVNSVHNIVINEESGFAYAVGASSGGTTCGGGLHMIDIHDPKNPTFAGCFSDTATGRSGTGYSHDAQCVTYKGPDTRYTGREICIGSNETAISIADVTDKKNPKALSHASYPNNAYAHQGWLTEDHKYFYLDDELDELTFTDAIKKTRTLIWDFTDLENPRLVKEHMGVQHTTDHNLYILGKQMYQANYLSGLRVLDITDPVNPREVSFFDTAPYAPNAPGFDGAWSVYPYFKSGNIVVNSISQGMFIIKQSNRVVF